jgi:dihydropteroate synthase
VTPESFNAWLAAPPWRPLIMGVLNVTPDSFSDGGRFEGPGGVERAADEAGAMAAAGADLIDIGGESTRPGSLPVPEAEQIRRVVPVLNALRERLAPADSTLSPPHLVTPSPCHLPGPPPCDAPPTLSISISIDTTRAAVAEAALDAGASVINDISAGRDDPAMLPLIARRGMPIVLMHMRGTPATMQVDPRYDDVTREVAAFLQERMEAARAAGIADGRILLDPGIGFGKTAAHNLELLRRLGELAGLGRPLVVGVSRKQFIAKVTHAPDLASRVFGAAAAVAWSIVQGAAVIRAHDVAAMSQVARMIEAIQFDKWSRS